MKELEIKIDREGKVLPGNILKVGSFLNQQIDVDFLMKMGEEIARLYKNSGVTKILTVEASGIALAVAAASYMHVPVVFAKKNKSANVSGDVFCSEVASFTHNKVFTIVISKDYISADDAVLIIDDFLAEGNALLGLIDLCEQAGAEVAGCAIAVEKGFQNGAQKVMAKGVRVESLAIVESMNDGIITFTQR
jgi:xanthine phosphoribosyltransferase